MSLIDLICDALFLVPDRWEELPLPKSPQESLRRAVWFLPFFLKTTALPDNELVTFAQNSGWHKIDKLLPLVYQAGWLRLYWEQWIDEFRRFANDLKVSDLASLGGGN